MQTFRNVKDKGTQYKEQCPRDTTPDKKDFVEVEEEADQEQMDEIKEDTMKMSEAEKRYNQQLDLIIDKLSILDRINVDIIT